MPFLYREDQVKGYRQKKLKYDCHRTLHDNMYRCSIDDLEILLKRIHELSAELHPGMGDELESFLTWLSPNEIESNHQMRPPTLRLKNTIKLFVNQPLNNRFRHDGLVRTMDSIDEELLALLRQYYLYQVRLHFFSKFQTIDGFRDVQKLEAYYDYPLKHVFLFQNNAEEWIIERNRLRHFLLNRNSEFGTHLKERLHDLIMEDDFDLVWDIVTWMNQANGTLSAKAMLIDLILQKISRFCKVHMVGVHDKRFLVMETFNDFILKYWSYFAQFLACPEDDHGITTTIYACFERQFIKIRIKEIYTVFVSKYPDSKPTILELKKSMFHSEDFKQLVIQFLSDFEENILNPSVTTVDALIAYVKAIKSFLQLDPCGKYLGSVNSFVKPHFQERHDLVTVLLYAILDLQSEEVAKGTNFSIDIASLKLLASELRDPEFSIESKLPSHISASEYSECDPNISFYEPRYDNGTLLYQDIMKNFLSWMPEAADSLPENYNKRHKNLLDILMTMFESKEFFVSEFLKLLRNKLLTSKYYKLNGNWSKCLKLMKEKLKGRANQFSANEPSHEEESSNNNNMDVMLWDIKSSEQLCKKMHLITGLDPKIFPKFISFLYWDRKIDCSNDYGAEFTISPKLSQELEKYCKVYKELQPGRTLHLCKDQGIVELELNFKDGRTVNCDATLEQCTVIELFDTENTRDFIGLTLADISTRLAITPERVEMILKFWVDKGVLYKKDSLYNSVDY